MSPGIPDLPSVSVVIPTCDRPGFLRQALASVAAQEHRPQEVVVVEDGDGAECVAGEWGSLPLRLIKGPRRGPGAARNEGVAAAKGEVIAFLDDDDLWRAEKLAWQLGWLAKQPRLGLLGTEVVRMRESAWAGPRLGRRPGRLRAVGRMALLKANRFAASSVVVRRECLERCDGFEESLTLAQDWDMWVRISERWEVAILPSALTCYRLHDGQRSARGVEMRRWEAEVVGRAMERGRLSGRLRGGAQRRLAWAHYRLGRALLQEGRGGAGVEALKAAVHLDPLGVLAWARLGQWWLGKRLGRRRRSSVGGGQAPAWLAGEHEL